MYIQVSSYPGQDVPIKLKAYDELNHTSAAIFRIDLNESEVVKYLYIYVHSHCNTLDIRIHMYMHVYIVKLY